MHASHAKIGKETADKYRKENPCIANTELTGGPRKGCAFGVLEPYDGKLSRPVLRGVWGGNAPDLPEWYNKRRHLGEN